MSTFLSKHVHSLSQKERTHTNTDTETDRHTDTDTRADTVTHTCPCARKQCRSRMLVAEFDMAMTSMVGNGTSRRTS